MLNESPKMTKSKSSCNEDSERYEEAVTGDETDEFVVDELLASCWFALDTGKTIPEIEASFGNYYQKETVNEAYEKLAGFLSTVPDWKIKLPRKSSKKETDIKNVVEVVRLMDSQNKGNPFVAKDLSKVCRVYGGLGEEIQLRDEVHRVTVRLVEVEQLLKGLVGINERMDNITAALLPLRNLKISEIPTAPATPAEGPPQRPVNLPFNAIVKGVDMNPATEKVSEPVGNEMSSGETCETNDLGPSSPISPSWQQAVKRQTRRKQQQQKKNLVVVGSTTSQRIQASGVRPVHMFVSRCHTKTTKEDISAFLEEKSLKPIGVEPIKTKFDTYSSWKVTFNKLAVKKQEVMKAENWPQGVMVREYIPKRGATVGTFSSSNSK